MRNSAIKSISSLGIILPFESKVSSPPKILPIVFFANKLGSELRSLLIDKSFLSCKFNSVPDSIIEFVFISRNYDGSELYYLVTYLTYDELDILRKIIVEQKGGILL